MMKGITSGPRTGRRRLRALLLHAVSAALFSVSLAPTLSSAPKNDFLRSAGERLEKTHGISVFEACPIADSLAADTIFREYGAIFIADGGAVVPTRCIFADESEVAAFQKTLTASVQTVGGVSITLQKAAMDSLLAARQEAGREGLSISPRGGSRAASRTFAATVNLWNSRFEPALRYWTRRGKISKEEADEARKASLSGQVSRVLEWEKEGIFFSTRFDKSILFSVAAPGASQHISMLALDVAQFGDHRVREIMAKHGWFQTVRSDLPHFTYLGLKESELPSRGLVAVRSGGHVFWVPELKEAKTEKH